MKKVRYERLATERANPRARHLDRRSAAQILRLMNQEDASVPGAVKKVLPQIERAVETIVSKLKNRGRLFFAGAGTSGRLGVIEAAECPPTFGTPPSLVRAVIAGGRRAVFRSREGAEDDEAAGLRIFSKALRPADVLVGIAAGGVTPFVRGALRAAKRRGAAGILVSMTGATGLAKLAGCVISPRLGPEILAGSTRLKAGTATKLILNMLTVASMVRLGKVYGPWMVDLAPGSEKLRSRALRLVRELGRVTEPEARRLLAASGWSAKAAILMARTGLGRKEARQRLAASSGSLRQALQC